MDCKEKCRLCLTPVNISVSLMQEKRAKMLECLTSIKVLDSDTFQCACTKCWLNLKLAYQISQNFIESDKKLRTQIEFSKNSIKLEKDYIDDNLFTKTDNSNSIDYVNSKCNDIIQIKMEESNEAFEQCPICASKQSSSNIYMHLQQHYLTTQKCDMCNKLVKDIKAYREHLTREHNYFPKIYHCKLCCLTFQYKLFYSIHVNSYHQSTSPKPKSVTIKNKPKKPEKKPNKQENLEIFISQETGLLECTECNKSFTSKKSYLTHIRNHEKGKCPICDARVTKYNLSKHIMLHNSGPSVCHLCGMTLKNIESLRGHLHYTHSERKLSCEFCGKVFTKLYSRTLHIKKEHTGEKSYICDTCGKSFFTQYTLNKHVKMTHLKLRPYICQFCQKGFSSRFAMRTHERQHTQETPYVCTLCGEGFRQNVSLRAHKKSKHNIIENKKFECKVCCKMFVSEWAVKSHMRLH